jgi:serine/threonine protein phosphatase PrpC
MESFTLSENDIASKDTGSASETPAPLTAKAFGVSDTGKVRTANEDQFLIAELSKSMRIWQTSLLEPKLQHGEQRAHIFLVADGMGGHKAGERASELIVLAIEQFMLNTFRWFFEADSAGAQRVLVQFQSALREADIQIVEESKADPALRGMGTTVTMAFHLGRQVCIVHVGDSRAYLHRDDALEQLTEDHTLLEQMRRSGTLAPDQALPTRFRHVITNAIGGNEAGVKVEACAFEVRPGDRLLLCTDGLTEGVTDEAITKILNSEPSPEAAAMLLLGAANAGPAADNITAVVVRFDLAE